MPRRPAPRSHLVRRARDMAAAGNLTAPRALGLVAPVEVARAAPEARVFELRNVMLGGLLTGPRENRLRDGEGRLDAVHRLLDTSLLLGLEERMVVERVRVLVPLERHLVLE